MSTGAALYLQLIFREGAYRVPRVVSRFSWN